MVVRILLLLVALGVVAQPVLDWEPRSDWLNVRTAGAAGDGVADDSAAIQSVLDQVKDGTTVYFPAGRYRLTKTVSIVGPVVGCQVIGHGAATVLVWDGEAGGKVFRDDGMAYSRIVGLRFVGGGRAAIGYWHDSDHRFETEVRHQHLAFSGFTDAAILAEPKDKFALAETTFENCLFEDCARGVAFLNFNDYNFTFTGCRFRRCGVGIDCVHGNFYARDCRFEGSMEVDIRANPEHGSSVRRCVSVGSQAFLHFGNSVTPMVVEECLVAGWLDAAGAIRTGGAPVALLNCRFGDGPGAPFVPSGNQAVLFAGNMLDGEPLPAPAGPHVVEVPYEPPAARLTPGTTFLRDDVTAPGKVFDARRDFGAVGDGQADDTAAIQAAVDAARQHGNDAIAYLPTGRYKITKTLEVTGGDYRIGGTGFRCRLDWGGPDGGTTMAIRNPGHLVIEDVAVGAYGGTNAADIVQYGTETGSLVVYDGVFVYGLYKEEPDRQGLHFHNLGARDVVNMPHVQGNLRLHDSGDATILGSCTYEGAITASGSDRGGFLGFMTRLTTHNKFSLYLRDNHPIVMSDYYIEQSDNGLSLAGSEGTPPGRAVIGLTKIGFTVGEGETGKATALRFAGWRGETFLLGGQFYTSPPAMYINRAGDAASPLFLGACSFYRTGLELRPADAVALSLVACYSRGVVTPDHEEAGAYDTADRDVDAALAAWPRAFADLHTLGTLDLRLNHPGAVGE